MPQEGRKLGTDPVTGHEIVAKEGRFGPYVTELLPEPEVPEGAKKKPAKPKVVTLADLPKSCSSTLQGKAPADESLVTFTAGYDPGLARATAVPVRAMAAPGNRVPIIVPIPARKPGN